MTMQPTIGVDISKDHLDAHRWPDGASLRVSNDAVGHKELIRWIGDDVTRVAYEATGAYHGALEHALHRAGLPCAKLNPARVRRFAEAVGTQAKTDPIDAALIARMAAMLEPAPDQAKPQALAELHELELARDALIRERTAARNRAGRLTLSLLKRQHARALKAIERDLAELGHPGEDGGAGDDREDGDEAQEPRLARERQVAGDARCEGRIEPGAVSTDLLVGTGVLALEQGQGEPAAEVHVS